MRTPLDDFRRAPLVPWAFALTVGILVDRFLEPHPLALTVAAVLGLLARWRKNGRLGLLVTWAALAGLAHHGHRTLRGADDIGTLAVDPPRLVRLRGTLIEEPIVQQPDRDDPLVPRHRPDRGVSVMAVRQVRTGDGWTTASGRVRLTVDRAVGSDEPFAFASLHLGDEVESTGMLLAYRGPANPGERDAADAARDRRLSAELRIMKSGDAVTRWESGSPGNLAAILANVRGDAGRIIDRQLPEREAGLARALLLGDGTAMARSEWDEFVRTGVVHVLAISGQHLVILAGFVWLTAKFFNLPRRTTAWGVVLLVVGYAAVTGLRPSAVRAAAMVAVMGLSIIRRKPPSTANALALAWMVVLLLDPTDLLDTGNLLSFGSVLTLVWGAARWLAPKTLLPAEQLQHEFRLLGPWILREALRAIVMLYLVNAILFVANAPLLAARQNIISPVGLLLGPPLVILSSLALLSGFVMLLLGPIVPPLAVLFAKIAELILAGCGQLVAWADRLPGGSVYLPGPPIWWVLGFDLIGIAMILVPAWTRRGLLLLIAWVGLLLAMAWWPRSSDELRMTFVSVGHGGCTVIECPDGRVLLVDVGTLSGPEAVRRCVAPFLWSRGIRRVDELFLSHADLDHFNGLPELLRRFPVGRITMTPSFAEKPTPEVATTLAAIRKAKVPVRIAVAGDRFETDDVMMDVLHPPPAGPTGTENERSLVLRLTHARHAILLTGDLEKQGTTQVKTLPAEPVDLLMAPHHGSRTAWNEGLARWAIPRFVIVNRGLRTGGIGEGDAGPGVPVWDTQTKGAITIRSHPSGLTAEAFRDGERVVIKK